MVPRIQTLPLHHLVIEMQDTIKSITQSDQYQLRCG